MKLWSLLAGSLALLLSANGQHSISSKGSGNWDAPATWDQQRVPRADDEIVIQPGHTVTLTRDASLSNITLRVAGILHMGQRRKLTLDASSIISVLSGGRLTAQGKDQQTSIIVGQAVKYRANKTFKEGWGSGVIEGFAYASLASGDLDRSGSGFIIGVPSSSWQDLNLFKTLEGLVQMVWVTSHETGTRIFEVQRSRDALAWKIIGQLRSAGNLSPENVYSYIDDAPGNGTLYYRIRHLDPDGRQVYSAVRSVSVEERKESLGAYPNPATDFVILPIGTKTAGSESLLVYDVQGRPVRCYPVEKGSTNIRLELGNLTKGIYTASLLQSGTGSRQFRFIKL